MQGISFTRTAATAGDHIDWMIDFAGRHELYRLVERRPRARKCPFFLSSINFSSSEVDLLLGHIAFVAVLDRSALSKHSAASMMPIAGTSRIAALPLNFGIDQFLPLGDFVSDQIGAIAERIRVVDLRQEGHLVGHALVQLGIGRLGDVHGLVGRDALARNFVTLELALGEDRQNVVEFLDLLDLDALQNAALGGELDCQPSTSAMSTVSGCVMKRLIAADVSRFCIVTLKPRSFDA